MATKYVYSVGSDTANAAVAPDKLADEIRASVILVALNRVDTSGDVLDIWFNTDLSTSSPNDVENLNEIVTAHDGIPYIRESIPVKVEEEATPYGKESTGSHYQSRTVVVDVDHAQDTWKDVDVTFPFPVSVFSTKWENKSNFTGDLLEVVIAPEAIIGVLVADSSVSDTTFSVSQTVVDNLSVGYYALIDDLVNKDDLGRVINIDKTTNQITVETPAVNAFLAATPTYIRLCVKMVDMFELDDKGYTDLGKDVIGGSYISAGTVIRVRYKNVEGTTTNKKYVAVIEYKY